MECEDVESEEEGPQQRRRRSAAMIKLEEEEEMLKLEMKRKLEGLKVRKAKIRKIEGAFLKAESFGRRKNSASRTRKTPEQDSFAR